VPERNAIDECAIADFDDPTRFPNVAVISFADRADLIVANARRLQFQRGAIDLPTLLVPWLAFVWGAGTSGNPLFQNVGMPASGMIETAFGMSGIELTPGIASAGSCPEAIWQSAIWWHDYYEKTATATPGGKGEYSARADDVAAKAPEGRYVTRQRAAAVIERDGGPRKRVTRRSGATRRRQR
jgi:hypothetical protein